MQVKIGSSGMKKKILQHIDENNDYFIEKYEYVETAYNVLEKKYWKIY